MRLHYLVIDRKTDRQIVTSRSRAAKYLMRNDSYGPVYILIYGINENRFPTEVQESQLTHSHFIVRMHFNYVLMGSMLTFS